VRTGQPDGMGGGGTGGDGGVIDPREAMTDGDQAGADIGNEHRNEERADAAGPALEKDLALPLKNLHAANAGAQNNPVAVAIELFKIDARIGHAHLRRDHSELGEAVHPARLLGLNIIRHREIPDLARYPGIESGGIKGLIAGDAALPGNQIVKHLHRGVAERRYYTHPGHNNSSAIHLAPQQA